MVGSIESAENGVHRVKHLKVDVEVGDRKTKGFKPHFKLNRWGGECFIDLGFNDSKIKAKDKAVKVEGGKVKWETPDLDFHYYPIGPRVESLTVNGEVHDFLQNDLGGFEWEFIFKKKPSTNIWKFPIQTEGLKFHYQPPLHPDHPTWADSDGDGIPDNFRPENVVGSYAVNHATRTRMHASAEDAEKYKCGIAFHIYYPYLVDAEGWRVRVEDFKIDNKFMTITLPQEFLDEATYPVTVGPTFGNTTIGGSQANVASNYVSWYDLGYSPEFDGSATSMSIYAMSINANTELALYEKTGNRTGTYVDNAEEIPLIGSWGWHIGYFTVSPSVYSATPYLLCFNKQTSLNVKYNTDVGEESAYQSQAYGTWPGTISGTAWINHKFSIICTYTKLGWSGKISGVVNPVEIAGVAVANIAKVKGVA